MATKKQLEMAEALRLANIKKRKKPKPRSSVDTMIKRYQRKLTKLKNQQKLQMIKKEVSDLQELIKQGY